MPQPSFKNTIVALASASGRAGVAVLRLSGPAIREAVPLLFRPAALPAPRHATLCRVIDPQSGEDIDKALVLFFPAPHSFTGEDVLEIHLHGGSAVIRATLDALCGLDGIRLAQAGEFSRRAFENGKMDLTEVEGLADLIDAETAAQRRQALRQMEGSLGQLYASWAEEIKQILAYVEAEIDFADEEIPPDLSQGRREKIEALCAALHKHLDDGHRGERVREGFTVALLGAPNAGKSSLLNALARREAAIVSPIPGTTRDVIEIQLDLGGYPVSLADTAGLRETADSIENEGVVRALKRAEQADLKLLVFDASCAELDSATLDLLDDNALVLFNKSDLAATQSNVPATLAVRDPLPLSVKTGEGLDALILRLGAEIEKRYVSSGGPALTRARHREALSEAHDHLGKAATAPALELAAEDLRMAIRSIGRITGHVDVEDILDVIFSSFCIGK